MSTGWIFLIGLNSALIAWQAYNLMRFMKLVNNRFERLERTEVGEVERG
jgi:hypothetical protein